MTDVLTPSFVTTVIALGITAAVPLLYASLGEIFAESSGVLNVGLEGMMLSGAFAGFVVTLETRELLLGLLAGGLAGALVSLLMVLFCIRLGLDQIVIGIGIVLAAEGATSLLYTTWFVGSRPRLPAIDELAVPILSELPVVGGSLFTQPLAVYVGLGLVVVCGWVLRRTTIGLNVRAAGERPDSLDAAGVSVVRVRTLAEVFCGALAGVGGAYLSIVEAGTFGAFVTGGVGFIAIVIAMLARGRVYWSILGALLFGMSLSIATALQLVGIAIPTDFVFMLPFISIIVVLILFARQARLPSALGLPYHRGSR
ncbi:MAG TPA: ABC transporter permease [Candidatus Limnocylindrales bacterium]|nr:ABC transporter permease [Candidatus Limnocylindrales bacterium]